MKICNKCKIEKEESCFPFKDKKKGKRSTICSECQKEYKKAYYYRNKESHYERNKITVKKLQTYASVRKDVCIVCGEREKICLDWHHLRDKDLEIAKICTKGSLIRLKKELQKCVVLCANCHRKLHAGLIKLEPQYLAEV